MKDQGLGRSLADYRTINSLSQTGLAEQLGITRQRLWDWETNGVPVGESTLVRLAINGLNRQRLLDLVAKELARTNEL